MTKRILITGASGFIGSFLVASFLDEPDLEIYAGIRSSSNRKYLQDERIHFFDFDLKDIPASRTALNELKFDYVIHNAGITQTQKESGYIQMNAQASLDFYQLLAELDRPPQKFVYMSSLGAYGPADFQPDGIVRDSSVPHPVTFYGKSKLQAEQWIKADGRIPYIFIRPTAVYGPRETNMLTVFKLINRGIEAHIGRTEQQLTFVYVKDLIEQIKRATLFDVENKSYFAASEKTYSSEDLANFAKFFLKKKTIKLKLPMPMVQMVAWISEKWSSITGHYSVLNMDKLHELKAQNWRCDMEPVKRELKFDYEYDLKRGVEETLRWYKEHNWL